MNARNKEIGARLRRIRKERGLTLKNVEIDTAIKESHLSYMERGESTITDKTIKILAGYYGINEEYIRTGEGNIAAPTPEGKTIDEYALDFALELFENLNDTGKNRVMAFINDFLKRKQGTVSEEEENDIETESNTNLENLRKVG